MLVDGREVGKSHRLRTGEVVELLAEPEPDAPPAPEPDVAVDVRYEDARRRSSSPSRRGSSCIRAPGTRPGTLVDGLLARYPEIAARR